MMSQFPDSAEGFYRLRDDRTNLCVGSREYQSVHCVVSLSDGAAATLSGQIMFITATNLLSRWCRNVTLLAPAVATLPGLGYGPTPLIEFVLSQMRDADPFGSFTLSGGHTPSSIALFIGDPDPRVSTARSVYVDGKGWLASIGRRKRITLPDDDDENCLGAIAAACLGVAQTFKLATGVAEERHFREGIFDLFALSWMDGVIPAQCDTWPQSVEIGRILMVGAGSVASAAAYCMRFARLAGNITIVDRDVIKIENFNRSPIFGHQYFGLHKSEAVAHFLKGSLLAVTPHVLWWDEFVRQSNRKNFEFDVWLPLANDFGVRFSIQNNLPPLVIHASTSTNWGVNHGRHIPGRDDCLADRFPSDTKAADLACATGEVVTEKGAVDAALPFTSLFAGLLITADLVRAQLPGYPQVPNFAFLDWYGPFDAIQAWNRARRTGCICTQQTRAMSESFNGSTRYWSLSRPNESTTSS